MARRFPELDVLTDRFAPEVLDSLDTLLFESDALDLEPWNLAQRLALSEEEATRLLAALAKQGVCARRTVNRCRQQTCGAELEEEDLHQQRCSACGSPFPREGEPFETAEVFAFPRTRSRDTSWVIAMHGINSSGPWQQQLQWLLDLTYRRTIPFANWKYGQVRLSAFISFLQRRLVKQFMRRFRAYEAEVQQHLGAATAPDIIAHSFGTWLLGHALQQDPSLRVGYVIVTGSILRPDFDWRSLVHRGQVKAVLNHYGTRDRWASLAMWFIPGSGPSGRIGFLRPSGDYLFNAAEPFGHSDFFLPSNLESLYKGVWQPFLRGKLQGQVNVHADAPGWRPPPFFLRAPGFLCLLALGMGTAIAWTLLAIS